MPPAPKPKANLSDEDVVRIITELNRFRVPDASPENHNAIAESQPSARRRWEAVLAFETDERDMAVALVVNSPENPPVLVDSGSVPQTLLDQIRAILNDNRPPLGPGSLMNLGSGSRDESNK